MLSCATQVQAAAVDAGTATYKLVGNRDIEHILDDLLHCVARPEEVSAVVTKLSATTFVQVRGVLWMRMKAGGERGGEGCKQRDLLHCVARPEKVSALV
jgi:hypothetical protein